MHHIALKKLQITVKQIKGVFMKILIISHEYPPIGGGGANACMYLSQEYSKLGHEVTIITAWFPGLLEEEKINNVKIIRVKSKRAHKEHCSFSEMLSYICKAWPVANKLVKQNKFDICQIFFGIPSGPIGYMLKKKYKIPYVIRFGGGDIPGFQDRFAVVYKFIGPFLKIIWNNADALIANSEGLRKMAMGFHHKKEIGIICNGVDIEKFHPLQLNDKEIRSSEINLLFVSRLIERKGLQHIIPIMNYMQEKTDKQIKLTIVGDGPYRKKLEDLVIENNCEQLVNFVGQKDKKDLLPYYQNADLFILPSKKEGMPNVVLEAMACGLPVVMTPCEGSRELIKDNGYIVEIENISDKIIELCNDEALRKKMADNSLKCIYQDFQWEMVAHKYINIFSDISGIES